MPEDAPVTFRSRTRRRRPRGRRPSSRWLRSGVDQRLERRIRVRDRHERRNDRAQGPPGEPLRLRRPGLAELGETGAR